MPGIQVLVADPDPRAAERIGPAIRRRGHRLQVVGDGNRALEAAILRRPDLVVIDEDCPFVDAAAFLSIVRGNPRLAHLPVVVQGSGSHPGAFAVLQRPASADDLGAIADRIGGDRIALGALTEGRLSHLSLVDLLQVFSAHRKSGRLLLRYEDGEVELRIVSGRIHDAVGPRIRGEKALFRYLPRQEGSFEFREDDAPVEDRIGRGMDSLLLEAMRRADELALIVSELPPPPSRFLALQPPSDPSLLPLVEGPLSLAELFDRGEENDLEIARALQAALALGEATIDPPPERTGIDDGALAWLRQEERRLLVTGFDPAELPGFHPAAARPAVGRVGSLELGAGARLVLLQVPPQAHWRPFAVACAVGACGALATGQAESLSGVELPTEEAASPREALARLLSRLARA